MEIAEGHTYATYRYHWGADPQRSLTYGAVQVIAIDSAYKWVRLKFRRIHVGPTQHFQKWIPQSIPQDIQTVTLEKTEDYDTRMFDPFHNKRGDEGPFGTDNMDFLWGGKVYVSDRPFGNMRGLYKLPAGTSLESVTLADVEALKSQFVRGVDLKPSDVVVAYLENYYTKTVLVMRVDETVGDVRVKVSIKYLERAKTPFAYD